MSITNEDRIKIREQICSNLIFQGITCPIQLISTAKEVEKFILLEDEEVMQFDISCLSRDKASLRGALLEFLRQTRAEQLAPFDTNPTASGSGASGGAISI
ncbi:hypothetical protein J559_3170 [Acinetobacter sp. 983759]|uniref:Uncharacterized protein n=1 Tax=uncultured Caudovirales phage TaxID=2100421 RepID=A0A2H4JB55_9CAUD|nr:MULTISPECIES: hypothetical protein [Acinetobacter]ASN69548.1 hypothetical protein 2F2_3 [uncultured Caudovirales phage]EXE11937.1 hypothetical protein J559_3170 [Acinetobacter sp. 983759]MCU4517926.1 hypothetical protein [Acinetobacter radioresistens]